LGIAEWRELREKWRPLRCNLNIVLKAIHRIDAANKKDVTDISRAS
jgi:hypothetical protein